MRGDDLELWEVGGEVVEGGQGPRHLEAPAEAPGRAGAHAGGAHIYKDRDVEVGDLLEERAELRIVHREISADRVEVEADEAEVLDGVLRLLDRLRTLPWVDRSPCVQHDVGMAVAKSRHVIVCARRAAGD